MAYVFAPEARPNNTTPTVGTFTGSAAAANVNVPAGSGTPQKGDLLIMLVENQGSDSTPTVSGTSWTKITDGTTTAEQVQGNTRLTAWYRIATGTDNATIDDMGDHQAGRIIVFRAGTYDPVNPFHKVVLSTQTATTAVSITGMTTTKDFCTILSCSTGSGPDANGSTEFSGEANADLTGLVECMDSTTAAGDGGSLYMLLGLKNTAGTIGATTVTAVTSVERANCMIAIAPNPGIVIRGIGAVAANTVAVSPGLPTGTVAGDLLIMFLETVAGAAITASGWSAVPGGDTPNDGTGTRLTVLYKIAAGGDATTTSDSGDHQLGRIVGIVAGSFDATTPFPDTNSNDQAATTSISISGVTTTRDGSLVLAASSSEEPDATSSSEYSAWANADLAWINEIIDNTSTVGTGSSVGVAAGIDTVAGSVGATTATAVTSGARANVCIVVQPPSSSTAYELDCQPGSFTITGFAAGVPTVAQVDAQDGAIAITGADAILSRGYNLNAEPGSFLIEDAESVGGGGPPEIDQNLGTVQGDTLTTAEEVAAGATIFIAGHWYDSVGRPTGNVDDDGAGLTWSVEEYNSGVGDDHMMAIWWAEAPDGLPDATPLTPEMSADPDFGPGYAAVSFLNVGAFHAEATPNTTFANPYESNPVTVTEDEAFIFAFSTTLGGNSSTHDAIGLGTEIHEWDTEGNNRGATQWAHVEAADDYTIEGDWDDPFSQAQMVLAFEVAGGGVPSTGATLETVAQIDAQDGAFAVTGAAATLSRGVSINAEPGSYSVTGAAATLLATAQLDAQPATYVVTGVAAAVMRSTDLNAQPGSFTITGAAATLPTVAALDAQPGSFAVTGVAAGLPTVAALHAVPGVYVITGVDADLAFDGGAGTAYTLDAEPGSFVITGAAATLATVAALDAQPGSLAITGAAALLSAGRTVNAEPGSFAITGVAASLFGELTLNAQPGVFTISGFDADLVLRGMPQLPLVGDIVLVSATGEIRVIAAEAEVALVPLEGEIAVITSDGEITTIRPEGDIGSL